MVKPDCLRPNTKRSDPKDIGELDHDLADRIWTMMQYAPNGALAPVSLYRDPGQQWDLRRERCPGHECDFAACKGYPTTATPYGSNHPKRLAADLGGRDLDWAYRNASRFGLSTPVKNEKWHFQKSGTPKVPIIPYPGKRWDDPDEPTTLPTTGGFLMALTDAEQREVLDLLRSIDLRAQAIQNETTDGANANLGGISKRQIASLTRLEQAVAAVKVAVEGLPVKLKG